MVTLDFGLMVFSVTMADYSGATFCGGPGSRAAGDNCRDVVSRALPEAKRVYSMRCELWLLAHDELNVHIAGIRPKAVSVKCRSLRHGSHCEGFTGHVAMTSEKYVQGHLTSTKRRFTLFLGIHVRVPCRVDGGRIISSLETSELVYF